MGQKYWDKFDDIDNLIDIEEMEDDTYREEFQDSDDEMADLSQPRNEMGYEQQRNEINKMNIGGSVPQKMGIPPMSKLNLAGV